MSESAKSFLSGGFGGMCLVAVGHPLDTIKVRLMTSNEYSGMMDCARKTIARDGWTGLYRGMSAPLIAITPIFATYFWGYDLGKQLAGWAEGVDKSKISLGGIIFAGGFSAIPGTMVMVPGDLIKVKLQVETDLARKNNVEPRFKGPLGCARNILATEGPAGFFKGTALTLFRDVPGSMAYYFAYEVTKKWLTPADGTLSVPAVLTAGGAAGIANWTVAVPPDVVKSRYQTAEKGRYPGGMRQVFSELLREEGVGAFFKVVLGACLSYRADVREKRVSCLPLRVQCPPTLRALWVSRFPARYCKYAHTTEALTRRAHAAGDGQAVLKHAFYLLKLKTQCPKHLPAAEGSKLQRKSTYKQLSLRKTPPPPSCLF